MRVTRLTPALLALCAALLICGCSKRPAEETPPVETQSGGLEDVVSDVRNTTTLSSSQLELIVGSVALLDDSDENVKVSIEKNYFMVDLENTKIVTRLIKGEYINYNKIIPSDFTTTVFVDKKALDTAIDRASLATRTEKKSVVKLEIREKRMSISAESEISGINEIVNIDLLGHDLNIGFNARYLSDSLRAISDDFVKLCFTTSTAPGVIVPTEKKEDEYLYLILPVRIIN